MEVGRKFSANVVERNPLDAQVAIDIYQDDLNFFTDAARSKLIFVTNPDWINARADSEWEKEQCLNQVPNISCRSAIQIELHQIMLEIHIKNKCQFADIL